MSVSLSEQRKTCQGKETENFWLRGVNKLSAEKVTCIGDPQSVFQALINLSGEKASDFLSGPPTINWAAKVPTAELVVTP